jgi:hypothetical protein
MFCGCDSFFVLANFMCFGLNLIVGKGVFFVFVEKLKLDFLLGREIRGC